MGVARSAVQARLDASGSYQRWVLLTGLVGMFATTFPVTLLAVSLSTIADDFDTSETLIAWVISAPLLGSAVALPILGKLGDLYGHRRVFLTGFAISTVITALTTLAWDPFSLIVLRGLAVVIGAATIPTSMALIMRAYPADERVKAMGWWSLVGAGAPVLGLVAGGPAVEAFGWRWIFCRGGPLLGRCAVVVGVLVLRETPVRRRRQGGRRGGQPCSASPSCALLFALDRGTRGAVAPVVPLGGGARAAPARRVPPVETRVKRSSRCSRSRSSGAATSPRRCWPSLFSGSAYMGGFILAPLLLQSVFALSVSTTSLVMLLRPASFSITSPIGGSLATRVGERPVAMFGSAAIAAALVLLGLGGTADLLWIVIVGLILQGIGNGTAQPTITATMSNSVDEADLGIAAAAQRMAFQVGSALGISTLTSIYGGTEQASDFFTAYLVGAGIGAMALVFAAMMRSTPSEILGTESSAEHQVDQSSSLLTSAPSSPTIAPPESARR